MLARTHDAAALAALTAYVVVQSPGELTVATILAALFANQVGGIVPDIDQPTAPFWRNLPVGRYFGRVFGALVGGHRFFCHSLLGVGAFAVGSLLLLDFLQPIMPNIDAGFVWVAFLIGVVSHLIMDSFTKEGVPWLLPLPFKFGFPPLRRLRITTGKAVELWVILPVMLGLTIWLCANHYSQITEVIQGHVVQAT